MSTTMEIGAKLVELCRQGQNIKAVETLYAADVVSIEAMSGPDCPQRTGGLAEIRKKNEWWLANHEVHSGEARGPFPNGDRFVVFFNYDITPKIGPMKERRMKMEEAALYTVKDGKIAQEEFFYHMG